MNEPGVNDLNAVVKMKLMELIHPMTRSHQMNNLGFRLFTT